VFLETDKKLIFIHYALKFVYYCEFVNQRAVITKTGRRYYEMFASSCCVTFIMVVDMQAFEFCCSKRLWELKVSPILFHSKFNEI